MIRGLIYNLVPNTLHQHIKGLSEDLIQDLSMQWDINFESEYREFLAVAGATEIDILYNNYDFRIDEGRISPFIPVWKSFLCVAYNLYPDGSSFYVNVENPSAGVFSLMDEQLHMMSHEEILADKPSYTCFASLLGNGLFETHLVPRSTRIPGFSRANKTDFTDAFTHAIRLGLQPLFSKPDLAIFVKDSIYVKFRLHIPAEQFFCRVAGSDDQECEHIMHMLEANIY